MPIRKGARQRPRGERRNKSVRVYLTPGEYAHIAKLAADAGVSESAFLYDQVAPMFLTIHLPQPDQDPLPFNESE